MVYHVGKVSLCGFFGGVFLGIVGSVSFCVGRNCHSEVEVRGFHVDLEVDPSFVHHRSGAPVAACKFHAFRCFDVVVPDADELGISVGFSTCCCVCLTFVDLREEEFDWCCDVPLFLHSVLVFCECVGVDSSVNWCTGAR